MKKEEGQTKKQHWFDCGWGYVLCGLIVFAMASLPILIFGTDTHTYLVKDATIEQVEQMTQADPNSRVWYNSANLLVQGSSLLEVTFRTRTFESQRISEYLDSIGVEYSELK